MNGVIDNNIVNVKNTKVTGNIKSNNLNKDDKQHKIENQKQTKTDSNESSSKDCINSIEKITNNKNDDFTNDKYDDVKKDTSKISSSSVKEIEEIIDQSLTETLSHKSQGISSSFDDNNEPVAGVKNWKMENDHAYGISVSLYEFNMLTKEPMGNPIADCYGLVVRGSCAAMALADGVNWGI